MIAIIYLVKATVIVLTAAAVVALGRRTGVIRNSSFRLHARDRWLAHAAARVFRVTRLDDDFTVPNHSEGPANPQDGNWTDHPGRFASRARTGDESHEPRGDENSGPT